MKKKWLLTGSAVGISGAVMLATGLTAFAGTSGYEDYKAALKNTAQNLTSVTVQADAVLKDNGSLLSQAQSNLKASRQNEAVSGTVKISGKTGAQTISLYSQPDGQVWKSDASDIYYVKQDKAEKDDREAGKETKDEAWFSSQGETVIDALIGNLKNEIISTAGEGGSKDISLQLDNAQIPAVVQALAPVAFKHLSEQSKWEHSTESGSAAKQSDPEELFRQSLFSAKDIALTDGVQIQSISLHAVVSPANEIQRQQFDITFTGQDAQGASHTLTASLDVQLSAINGTTPDSVDLTGKQVVQVKDDHEGRHHE
ncbi:hypothetical protein [Paenibacillus riograndensis]|uniref:Putative secreted protein n=1 Tax=Paenibacillus riograndensis SBR5 TaxID=1073571 RepID=A0A0E4CVV4_9BACL|nr:hypothetical protein [Paenibacillus riograndensis]CQR54599.1 putative secreted protein [Paenibacillus riograndensis SBR5]